MLLEKFEPFLRKEGGGLNLFVYGNIVKIEYQISGVLQAGCARGRSE